MPRTARASQGGYCYHVLNRGNARRTLFHKDGDFRAFVKLLKQEKGGERGGERGEKGDTLRKPIPRWRFGHKIDLAALQSH